MGEWGLVILKEIFVLFKLQGNLLKSVRKAETMLVNVLEGKTAAQQIFCAQRRKNFILILRRHKSDSIESAFHRDSLNDITAI